MNTTNQIQTSNSDFIFAWAMERYSPKSKLSIWLESRKPEYTAGQVAAAVALNGNPSGF